MPSYTKAAALILFASYHLAIAAPVPDDSNQVGNAYTGTGGNASGGDVLNSSAPKGLLDEGLIKLFSGLSFHSKRQRQHGSRLELQAMGAMEGMPTRARPLLSYLLLCRSEATIPPTEALPVEVLPIAWTTHTAVAEASLKGEIQ